MSFFPDPPQNFRVTSVQITPAPKMSLVWDQYALTDDILYSNNATQLTALIGNNPERISAHNRSLVGYELWRNNQCNFTPPEQGDLLADEAELDSTDTTYDDENIEINHVYYYKLAAKINQ